MEDVVMTNEELNAWRMVGADIGFEFDELGHPYKPGPARDQTTLEFYQGAYDWRPMEDDSDCIGLMLHYQISVHVGKDCLVVRDQSSRMLAMSMYPVDVRVEYRRIVFQAAAYLVRDKLAKLDSVNTCTLNKL